MAARFQLSVILTDECNMRCRYCTTAKRPVRISAERIARVLELLERTAPAPLDLGFHGGEPTLEWDRVVQLAEGGRRLGAQRRVSLNLCTNGTHLDAERAAWLAAYGFNARVSIDGRNGAHTLYRLPRRAAQDGSAETLYERSLGALRLLIDAGATTSANMVVTPATADSLLDNATFLIDQGLVHLVVSPVVGMPWERAHLESLDRQLVALAQVWRAWMARHPTRHEDLRRSLLSEIDRAEYCMGLHMNQSDSRVLVIGPDGRIFGDEPDARTERALVVGHLDEVTDLDRLPYPPRNAFELMYDRQFYAPRVLEDVRRTHQLLRHRTAETYRALFGPPLPQLAPLPG